MERVRAVRDALLAHDPGWVRLRTAGRVTLSAILGYAGVYALSRFAGVPIFHVVLGTVVGLIGGVAVNDATPGARRVSVLLLPIPAAASMTLAGLLAPHGLAAEGGLVPVIFLAVLARKLGPRGFAYGFVGFVLYFATLIFARRFGLSVSMFASLLVGAAAAYVARFWVFRDVIEASTEDLVGAVEARVRQLLGEVGHALASPGGGERRLRRRVVDLNETVLRLDERIGRVEPSEQVFEIELAAQRLAVAASRFGREAPGGASTPLLVAVGGVRRSLGRTTSADAAEAARARLEPLQQAVPTGATAVERAVWTELEALAAATRRIRAAGGALREAGAAPAAGAGDGAEGERSEDDRGAEGAEQGDAGQGDAERGDSEQGDAGQGGAGQGGAGGPTGSGALPPLDPVLRQALQASLAAAVAIAGGMLISPRRWYWAAIAAFVVFTGTSSRGDVLVKGWQRVLGTLVGAVVGVLVATALNGDLLATTAALLASMFLAFYFFQISYAAMIGWITVMIALLYGLLGVFSVHLLELRLFETAYGVVAGGVVAFLFLPSPTRHQVADASADLLRRLADLLEGVAERSGGRGGTQRILGDLRAMDGDLQQLRGLAGPLTRWTPGGQERAGTRHWLRALIALRLDAHRLADLARRVDGAPGVDGGRGGDGSAREGAGATEGGGRGWPEVAAAGRTVAGRFRGLASALQDRRPARERARRPWVRQVILEEARDRPHGAGDAEGEADPAEQASRVLQRLDWAVSMLAADLGLPDPPAA